MALCQFPLNLHTVSSSTSSSPQFRRLQPLDASVNSKFLIRRLRFRSFNHTVRFNTRELSGVIRATIDVDTHQTKKTKRKPKPGFFEEISDKWSSRISPKTEKLPWQKREEQIKHHEEEEAEEVDEEEDESSSNLSSGYGLSGKRTDSKRLYSASEPSSFPRPSGYMSPPWVNNNGGSKGVSFTTSSEQGSQSSSFDDVFTVDRYRRGIDSSNRTVESDLDNGERGVINSGNDKGIWRARKSNTVEAERIVPEHELSRLRTVALRMVERVKVGSAGITQALVEAIHDKWEVDEVVKLKFSEPFSLNMKRTHEVLEKKTGGLVIWRSGSSVVLYRGISYKLKCVQSFIKQNNLDTSPEIHQSVKARGYIPEAANYPKNVPKQQLSELCELNDLLDEIGPRFHDWTGCDPLPVDADLLPPYVEGYRCPFRILPQGVKPCLSNTEMTEMRRLARTSPPHFALGRSRELQGLAKAMVKLWAKSTIAKIAIKRGVENTRNERMAEELKRLTRGVLVSRNKEYIVFYRGNDFMPPAVAEALTERQKEITEVLQTKEDQARGMASTRVTLTSQGKLSKTKLLAGTLAETIAASSRWAPDASSVDIEELKRESVSIKRSALIRDLELRLLYGKQKLRRAERALAKVQMDLDPSDLPTDSEIITEEERLLYRKIGLSMDPFLLLGRREVYAGTIENMHLHWKHRELVKVIVRGKSLPQVKHIAISLEAESGGVLVSVDKTMKGYAIILYRGKNYQTPFRLRPSNLLTRKKAFARSIELQRREALKYHVADLEERIELLKTGQDEDMETRKKSDGEEEETLYLRVDESDFSSDEDESVERDSEKNETFLSSVEAEEEET
ncbi:PREDICTED: CRM-domain containing factor CFM3A, chloroplastic/mitochondrial-like isoform X2 [Camelina sativa]|uniref:CRM-domain containing factor CFM3A, chloroplastic/mitochondrial-like isoform X2 n=1 Tax=Camelina sativa TaxID=90675 RepID=A0ABM0TY00_CAMSA|nr:PREDICTED: CRM-domain containing factor CFM3A, chloroplastic/mitochondrial-like isoform X2 [Camelina sativa]